ncbi:hypothetical protein ACOSP7_010355 [Xanthoceras sorbifolium]
MMAKENKNAIVRFNGKNYLALEFQFKMYVKGKELWNYIDGTSQAPASGTELAQWESKDARVVSWLLGSIEPHMVNNLRSFTTAKQMWEYLKRIYNQDNNARRFQLELEIANYNQGNLSIEQFYGGFLSLWNEYSGIVHAEVPKAALGALLAVHEVHLVHGQVFDEVEIRI